MGNKYLPGTVQERIQDLMKERKITQSKLAEILECTESTLSRFISGKTDKIGDDSIVKIANYFGVSTDFLLGLTNISDRKNYDVGELGLSVEAAKRLYTGKVNTEVVTQLLENDRFAEVTHLLSRYFDDTISAGYASQNQMFDMLSSMILPENKEVTSVIKAEKAPPNRAELTGIQSKFMAAVAEIKKSKESKTEASQKFTKEIMQKFMIELQKESGNGSLKSITPEQIMDAVARTAGITDAVSEEALESFKKAGVALFAKVKTDGNDE